MNTAEDPQAELAALRELPAAITQAAAVPLPYQPEPDDPPRGEHPYPDAEEPLPKWERDLLERQAAEAAAGETRWCPAFTHLDDEGVTLYCDRPPGHAGSHHAPGPDEGSEVAWSDTPAQQDAPEGEPSETDESRRMRDEGITGMYWDNLGSGGSES